MDDLLNRHDLTDEEWQRLASLMPGHPRQGHRWIDRRTVVNGILFGTSTGCPWRDLPPGFGNWNTVYGRHRRWSLDGTWEEILDVLRAGCDQAEGKDWTVSADSTAARQHAAGARRASARRALPNGKDRRAGAGREALGRSRGGLTAKVHLAASRRCRPIARITSPGLWGSITRSRLGVLGCWIWPGRPAELESSLGDLLGRLPPRALPPQLHGGPGAA